MPITFNGKRVTPGQLGDLLKKSITQKVQSAVEARVYSAQTVRCPVHGKAPRILRTGKDFKVEGCCEELVGAVRKKLAG